MSVVFFDDQDMCSAVNDASSPEWAVRAAAGRRLALSTRIAEVADVLLRLLLDAHDTGVTAETAEALLSRKDIAGLRCVLLARSQAEETWTADEIHAALYGDPGWMPTEGPGRLIKQLQELTIDEDEGVRGEAERMLADLRRVDSE
ncbi:hypothetical protein ACH4S8_04880 [Streptomyces sp. NPDC021080]|uniref:hypothetical protein n=1 Tax=Streptomyces sp. NPDC021080 TaxID=3365110 RepID=UPI003798F1E5